MQVMEYDRVILIGSGKIAVDCLNILLEHTTRVLCMEYARNPLSILETVCKGKGITYKHYTSRAGLTGYFLGTCEKTLVVSANNNYIFPKKVLENSKLKIINFHNALLPRHRGRNAPTWAIYAMEERTGITWHEVNAGIDTGNIIIQKEVPIGHRTTALELVRECMVAGVDAFREIISPVLAGEYPSRPQTGPEEHELHYSWEVPNNGYLDITWPIQKISAFLRSLDYGKAAVFPKPRMVVLGREYTISGYRIQDGKEEKGFMMTGHNAILKDSGIVLFLSFEGGYE